MISILWNPIQKYIDKLKEEHPMLHVFHYTSVGGALGILKSGRLWFTERSHLNDTYEVLYGVEMAKAILQEKGMSTQAGHLERIVKNVFENFRFFSGSFSLKDDDMSQWRTYADDGKGVILSFKNSIFNNLEAYIDGFLSDTPNFLACPMSYNSCELRSVINSIIEAWDKSNIDELSDHIFMISSMFKNDCWESENEYRFFVHAIREKILKSDYCKFRERNGEIVSYLDIPIKNWDSQDDFPIYQIRIGPAAPLNLKAQIADFLSSQSIPISPDAIIRSDLPYRSFHRI